MIIIKTIGGVIGFSLVAISISYWKYYSCIKRGKSLENQKRYKEAIYSYASTILKTSFGSRKYYKKIKELSDKYGPFNYDDILQKNGTLNSHSISSIVST